MAHPRAAFGSGLILAGEAIRCIARVARVIAGLGPKFCAGAFLVAFSALSHAETISATVSSTAPVLGWATGPDWGATQAAACTQAIIHNGASGSEAYLGVQSAPNGQLQCWFYTLATGAQYAWSNLRQSYGCTNFTPPYSYADQTSCAAYYTCPPNQNWALSGNTCTRPDCNGVRRTNARAANNINIAGCHGALAGAFTE